MKHVKNALRSSLNEFICLDDLINVKNFKTLNDAFVQSQLSYGTLGWGGVAESNL